MELVFPFIFSLQEACDFKGQLETLHYKKHSKFQSLLLSQIMCTGHWQTSSQWPGVGGKLSRVKSWREKVLSVLPLFFLFKGSNQTTTRVSLESISHRDIKYLGAFSKRKKEEGRENDQSETRNWDSKTQPSDCRTFLGSSDMELSQLHAVIRMSSVSVMLM